MALIPDPAGVLQNQHLCDAPAQVGEPIAPEPTQYPLAVAPSANLSGPVEHVSIERLEEGPGSLPRVTLPGRTGRITDCAPHLGLLLAATGRFYCRDGVVVSVEVDEQDVPRLKPMKLAAMPTAFEEVAQLFVLNGNGKPVPSNCTVQTARVIIDSETFLSNLPPIKVVTPCPVLIERDGGLKEIHGYDRQAGILAGGTSATEMSLDDAKVKLGELLQDFSFATPSDRSRALAAIITPALLQGGLLGGRAPIDLGEADASQTGKGYRNKLTAAVYNNRVATITQRRGGGVGGIEESLSDALIKGENFICFDNIRGSIDSPALESLMTEDTFSARVPYRGIIKIDPRLTVFMVTSNRAEITPDLANRSSLVRLRKQPDGYEFQSYDEGDLLDHVRANSGAYLGAVFAVVRAWHADGKQRSRVHDHSFRPWAQTLDWIVQELLEEAPLLDGHAEAAQRVANPTLNWLRDVVHVVDRANRLDEQLSTSTLLNIMENEPHLEIPGFSDVDDLSDSAVHDKTCRATGRTLSKCFKESNVVTIDGYRIERHTTIDEESRKRKAYVFTRPESLNDPA